MPTIAEAGVAKLHALVPVPVDTRAYVPDGVDEPVPSFVSTAIRASCSLLLILDKLGLLVSSVAEGFGNVVPLSTAPGNSVDIKNSLLLLASIE